MKIQLTVGSPVSKYKFPSLAKGLNLAGLLIKNRSASGGSCAKIDLQIHKEKIKNLKDKKKESYTVQFYTHRPCHLLIIQVANYRIITHFEPIKLLLSRAFLLIDVLSCH